MTGAWSGSWAPDKPGRARRDPRIQPRKGDHLAKVVTFSSNGVSVVQGRRVLSVHGDVVEYTPKRVRRKCSRKEWRAWARNTGIVAP